MSTHSWQAFDAHIRVLKQYLQISDLALNMVNKRLYRNIGNGKKIAQNLGSSVVRHMQLNIPTERVDIRRVMVTSRNKLHNQAIVDMYSIFSQYIADVIAEIQRKKPFAILSAIPANSERSLKYDEIMRLGNYNAILSEISKRIFRSLENERSTIKLITKLIKTTQINVAQDKIDNALLYLELRHLIIHNNACADTKFMKLNTSHVINVNAVNKKVILNYTTTNMAITSIFILCKTIDDEIVRKGLV